MYTFDMLTCKHSEVQSFAMNEFAKWRRRYCPFYEHAVKIGSSID